MSCEECSADTCDCSEPIWNYRLEAIWMCPYACGCPRWASPNPDSRQTVSGNREASASADPHHWRGPVQRMSEPPVQMPKPTEPTLRSLPTTGIRIKTAGLGGENEAFLIDGHGHSCGTIRNGIGLRHPALRGGFVVDWDSFEAAYLALKATREEAERTFIPFPSTPHDPLLRVGYDTMPPGRRF